MKDRDTITVKGLKVRGYHGVLPFEKTRGQDFVVDIELEADLRGPAREDDISVTVDYSRVVDNVARIVRKERYDLIETLASRIAEVLLDLFPVSRVEVTVKKPAAPLDHSTDWVGVTICRAAEGESGS